MNLPDKLFASAEAAFCVVVFLMLVLTIRDGEWGFAGIAAGLFVLTLGFLESGLRIGAKARKEREGQ